MKIFFDCSDKRNEIIMKKIQKKALNVEIFNDFNEMSFGDLCVFAPNKNISENDISNIKIGIKILCGDCPEELKEKLKLKNVEVYCYFENESFAIYNALLTAEGVLPVIYEHTQKSIFESKFLILGLGRIGKALVNLFEKLNVKYDIGSLSIKDENATTFFNCKNLSKGQFISQLCNYDVIINTIPKMIINKEFADTIKKDAVFIETASVDALQQTQDVQFKYVKAAKLPQKYTLISASKLMENKLLEVLNV